jgi:hypothetical protein
MLFYTDRRLYSAAFFFKKKSKSDFFEDPSVLEFKNTPWPKPKHFFFFFFFFFFCMKLYLFFNLVPNAYVVQCINVSAEGVADESCV